MNFQFYFEKLSDSPEFKKFKEENSDCYLCSGFFSIDKEGQDNQQHLDFYVPSEKKMFSFQLEKKMIFTSLEDYDERVPNKIKKNFDFDFKEVEELISKKIEEEKVNKKIQKLLLSFQNKDGKHFIIGTVFVSGLGIIKIEINLDEKKIENFEKKSFFDMLKIMK